MLRIRPHAPVAQRIEYWPPKPRVVGSNPAGRATLPHAESQTVRRAHRRGRSQRADLRLLSRRRGIQGQGARAPRGGGRRGGHRGVLPGLPQFRRRLHREPAAPQGDPRPAARRARPEDRRAADRQFPAALRQRLPQDRQLARPDPDRARAVLGARRRAAARLLRDAGARRRRAARAAARDPAQRRRRRARSRSPRCASATACARPAWPRAAISSIS